MDKKEALIRAIRDSVKIRHSSWNEGEYVSWCDSSGFFVDETNQLYRLRMYEIGDWEIYKETFNKAQAIEYMLEGKKVQQEKEDGWYLFYCSTTGLFLKSNDATATYGVALNNEPNEGWYLREVI